MVYFAYIINECIYMIGMFEFYNCNNMAKRIIVKDDFMGRRSVMTESDFNENIKRWASETQRLAKDKASQMLKGKRRNRTYQSGPKKGKTETKLRNSIQYSFIASYGEASGIAFQFPMHGIFREYGVGNGSPRNAIKRSKSDWLSGTLDRKEKQLTDIIDNYSDNLVSRIFRGVGNK